MIYVLMVFFLHGTGPRTTMVTQEFGSEKACLSAAAEVRGAWQANGDERKFRVICMPKGEASK
jgi:hypothetical protein